MNAEKFSEAIGNIDDRYISEAISYKPKKKKIHLYKSVLAFAAVLAVVVTALIVPTFNPNKIQVYMGNCLITGKTVAVPEAQKGISLLSETENVSVFLSVKTKEGAHVSVSDGFVYENESSKTDEDKNITISESASLMWSIENAHKSDFFTMEISSSEGSVVLELKFSTDKNSWVISKI